MRPQFQNARMAGQQRAHFERHLGTKRNALLDQPSDQVIVGHIGYLEGAPLGDHIADQSRARFGIGLRRAGFGKTCIQIAELLRTHIR